MSEEQTTHDWFESRLAIAAMNGLDADEREVFEEHLATCAACRAEYEIVQAKDDEMMAALADRRVAEGLEDRLLANFWAASERAVAVAARWRSPALIRAAASVAAVLLVGSAGYVGTRILEGTRELNLPLKMSSTLRQIGQAFALYTNDVKVLPSDGDVGGGANGASYWSNWNNTAGVAESATSREAPARAEVDEGQRTVAEQIKNKPSLEEQRKRDTVRQLIMSSRKFTEQGKYADALGVVDQMLTIDPNNDYAKDVRPLIADRAIITEQRKYKENFSEKDEAHLAEAESNKAPRYKDILRYPENWPDLSNGRAADADGDGIADSGPKQFPAERVTGDHGMRIADSAKPNAGEGEARHDAPTTSSIAAAGVERKIIRNGQLEYEVDSFDTAVQKLTSLVRTGDGVVATTSSEKLPNGKVRGVVIVRVAPDRLDDLVASLRAIGELKRQNLTADDVTKQYTDTESELRAAHAMQERLLEMIKSANGQIKDLLATEKELAVWREKIEKAQGELNYYNNLVSRSTLTISLTEKDIAAAVSIVRTENYAVSLEATDVSSTRDQITQAVENAKGRVTDSQLTQQAAGQFAARLTIEIAADQAPALLDRFRQLGRIDHLESQQTTSTSTGDAATSQPARLERRDAHVTLSIYNVANLQPRTTTTLRLAAGDVQNAYDELLKRAADAGARIVTSAINTAAGDQSGASVRLELPAPKADGLLAGFSNERALPGTTLLRTDTATANADDSQSTIEKRGIEVSIQPIDALPPATSLQVNVETTRVSDTVAKIITTTRAAGGRVVGSTVDQSANGSGSATVAVDVPTDRVAAVLDAVRSLGTVRDSRSSQPDPQSNPNALTGRTRLQLQLRSPAGIVQPNDGILATLRRGLATSAAGLLWSLQMIVIGLCLLGPWILLGWGAVRLGKRWFVAAK